MGFEGNVEGNWSRISKGTETDAEVLVKVGNHERTVVQNQKTKGFSTFNFQNVEMKNFLTVTAQGFGFCMLLVIQRLKSKSIKGGR